MCEACDSIGPDEQVVIEYPAAGATYGPAHGDEPRYGVYRYGEYPEGSTLAGQPKRSNLGSDYETLEAAQADHPNAEWGGIEGSGFDDREVPHTPPPDFDPDAAGETWSERDL